MRYDKLPERAKPYILTVQAASRQTMIPEEVLWAVMASESAFDHAATSPAGAVGLMQLMPTTGAELGVDVNNPLQNIAGGAEYLRRMLSLYKGNLSHALAAYNWGFGNLGWSSCPAGKWPLQTQKYVTSVAKHMAAFMGA